MRQAMLAPVTMRGVQLNHFFLNHRRGPAIAFRRALRRVLRKTPITGSLKARLPAIEGSTPDMGFATSADDTPRRLPGFK